ncbi:hypothetical protein Golomagni_02004 [Golovinomyces magnicellulatus]|nr:hypothetical protein Golomagni_02004 [Golovinomyces magnicellulatus]
MFSSIDFNQYLLLNSNSSILQDVVKSLLTSLTAAQLVAGHGSIIRAIVDMYGMGFALHIKCALFSSRLCANGHWHKQSLLARLDSLEVQYRKLCPRSLDGGINEPAEQVAKFFNDSNGMSMVSTSDMIMTVLFL